MQPQANDMTLSRRTLLTGTVAAAGGLLIDQSQLLAAAQQPAKAPFSYVHAKAYHIPPETNTEKSGYFALCEGRNTLVLAPHYIETQLLPPHGLE